MNPPRPRFRVWPAWSQEVISSGPLGWEVDTYWQPQATERDADGWIVAWWEGGTYHIHLAGEDVAFATAEDALRAAEELARARGGTTRPWDGHDPEDEDEEDAP